MKKVIALVDCNNFYASCQRAFEPKYEGKPVVVLSNNDGCVIARSNEAKALGIKMGDPYFKLKEAFKKNCVKVYSSNYTLYGDMSDRVMNTLSMVTPDFEIYSIDEAFMELTHLYQVKRNQDVCPFLIDLKSIVFQNTKIPVSIGVAPTKTLAKIANKRAKKDPKSYGVLQLDCQDKINLALKETEIGDVWGIGKQYSKMLISFGYQTAYDFTKANENWVKKKMSIVGLRTLMELRGFPCIEVAQDPIERKNICCSRSFGKAVLKLSELEEAVSTFVKQACEKLRKQKSSAQMVTVFVSSGRFSEKLYHNSRTITFPVSLRTAAAITNYALMGLKSIFKEGISYKNTGILLNELCPDRYFQEHLFNGASHQHEKISTAVDFINLKYGRDTIFLGSEGIKKSWEMKREFLSPCFTTKLEDIIKISDF